MKDRRIFFVGVAAHKKSPMFGDRDVYEPIQVGAILHDRIAGYTQDSEGDSISALNDNFSELTALYYLWKNIDSSYKGLVHYRRYFARRTILRTRVDDNFIKKQILSKRDLNEILSKYPIILPNKRNYYIESNYVHYARAHNSKDLDLTRSIIERVSPDFLTSFDQVMNRRSAHMFNMFIMKYEYFDEYCSWLFKILFELKSEINIDSYSKQEARVFGFVSELLLDVWINEHDYSYTEKPVLYTEGQHLPTKILLFLRRHFLHGGKSHIESHVDN